MLTRSMKMFFGVILYLLFFSLALVPLLVIRPHIESVHYTVATTIWALGTALFFFPALAIIIKKAWLFKGKGEPAAVAKLHMLLLETNEFNAPVTVNKIKNKLVATWKHQDQSWCELLEKKKMKKLYELWMDFDNNTKTVIMSDKYRSADWKLSPIKLETGWFALSKPYFNVKTGSEWGVENYTDTSPDDYSFTPNEIKSPFLNTILKNGWNVRFSLF